MTISVGLAMSKQLTTGHGISVAHAPRAEFSVEAFAIDQTQPYAAFIDGGWFVANDEQMRDQSLVAAREPASALHPATY